MYAYLAISLIACYFAKTGFCAVIRYMKNIKQNIKRLVINVMQFMFSTLHALLF
jgi:hypothetical protein